MNINDVEKVEETDDYLKAIFDKQRELALKYHPIEAKSGLLQTHDFPVNLHDPRGQARLKDLAWRTIEELGEATECIDTDKEHFREELIDALHFFIELLLSANMSHNDFGLLDVLHENLMAYDHINYALWVFTESLSLSMNCLKNKPWKQTHMETDVVYFKSKLEDSMTAFIAMLKTAGLTPEDIYSYYFKKNQVNQFRQRSNY